MRLQRFSLDRFGHFENKVLDLSSDVIHVIHGPNASGKSTIRMAVAELLFGIEERTTYDFRFDKSQLRLSAQLASRDGDRDISFSRYKRRAKSLLGDGDVELEENALLPFLCGLDKATFLDLYVMDQDALRKGGEHMLSAEGDVGRSLFAASSGFADLSALRTSLKDELDEIALVGQKRKTNKLWKREEEYNQARERQRISQLRKGDWDAANKALTQAKENMTALTKERHDLEANRSLLERIKVISLILPRLDSNKSIIECLASVPELPRDFAERWRKAESDLQSAVNADASAKAEKGRLDAERQALPQSADSLIAFTEDIESLHQGIGNIADLRQSQTKLERDIRLDSERLSASLAELGAAEGGSDDTLLSRIPTRAICTKVEGLIADRGRIDAALGAASNRMERAQENLDEAKFAVGRLAGAIDPSDAEVKWRAVVGQGNVRRAVSQARRKTEEARTAEGIAISKLTPWTGSANEIVRLSLPSPEAVATYEARIREIENDLKSVQEADRKAKASLRQIEELISPHKLAGEVPTESMVRTARSERDTKWTEIAGAAEAGQKVPALSLNKYTGLVKRADDLVDLHVQSNELPTLLRNRAELVAEVERITTLLGQINERRSQVWVDWTKLWQRLTWPADGIPEPQMMQAWLGHIKICLIAIDAHSKAEAAQSEAETEENDAQQAVIKIGQALGLTLSADLTLEQLREQVGTEIAQSRRKWDEAKRAQNDAQQHQKELNAATIEHGGHEAALTSWRRKWAEAMPQIHQKPETEPADSRGVLTLWGAIRDDNAAKIAKQTRLDGVVKDLENHEAEVRDVIAKLDPAKVQSLNLAYDWAFWPAKLHRSLQEATNLSLRIQAADKACSGAKTIRDKCAQALKFAEAACDSLRNSASLAQDANVSEIIEHAAQKREAMEQYRLAEKDLQQAGEGLPEDKLREETASVEPDQVKARLATLSARALTLDDSMKQASTEQLLATQQLHALKEKTGFTVAALEADTAAQDIKQLTQRWMRLRAAQILLDRAVERYRKSNEGPLIRRASEIFSAIVRDRMPDDFTELAVDYENPEKPLIVARRKAGTSCNVPKMSTGTRDQLWLSLRIAALERRSQDIEPMPFLADDLFDSSDEARSAAMLTAVAELARHTQVIVFTHHDHVASMAGATLGARAQIHRLQAANR